MLFSLKTTSRTNMMEMIHLMTYINSKTILEWLIKTEKMKSVTRQQDNNNKYTGSRDDDSSSKKGATFDEKNPPFNFY